MKINRQELLDTLSLIKPGLANNDIVEQSTHFIFEAGEIYTYNDQITISHQLETDFDGIAIQAGSFYKLLEKLKEPEIDCEIDANKLTIKSGKTKAAIAIEKEIKIPAITLPEEWIELPNNFNKAVKFSLFSVSNDMTRLALTCLNIDEDYVLSCDNYRATKYKLDNEVEEQFYLNGSAARILIRYEPTDYAIDDAWIHFTNEAGTIFSCRKMEIDYPDILPLFDVKGDELELPEDLIETIDRVGVFVSAEFDHDKFIELNFQKNKLICKSKGNTGWVEEEVKIKWGAEPITIKIHPDHFMDILKHLQNVVIGERSFLFSGANFNHTISLLTE